jgi:hypothetical protein
MRPVEYILETPDIRHLSITIAKNLPDEGIYTFM